jgi:hypothetical protein
MSKAEFTSGHDGAKSVAARADSSEDLGERLKQKYSETRPIAEEELAPSRAKFVASGGQLPTTGVSQRGAKAPNPAKTRGMILPQEIKQKDASRELEGLHTMLKSHAMELVSHTDHNEATMGSLAQASHHITQAKASLNEAHRLKQPQEINGKMMKFTSEANKKYQEAAGHLLKAHGHLDADHVRQAAGVRKVSSGIPESSHVEDLHSKVKTLQTMKPAAPFKELKFGGTTIKGETAMSELSKLAQEKGAPTPVKEKISRARRGTARVSKFEKLTKGRGQQELTKGDYTNPQRSAGSQAPIVGRGPMAQRKPGRTPGFEG